jgi:hypothetical protein
MGFLARGRWQAAEEDHSDLSEEREKAEKQSGYVAVFLVYIFFFFRLSGGASQRGCYMV